MKNPIIVPSQKDYKNMERYLHRKLANGGGGSGSASSLSDMTDVDILSPSDGDTLVYNATTGKWENGSGSGSHLQ